MNYTTKIVPVIAGLVFMLSAAPAHAAGLTQTQIDAILGLLRSFDADAATVAKVEGALTGNPVTGTPNLGNSTSVGSASCVALTRTLYRGMSDTTAGGEILKLQKFLGIAGANGYFGPATESALQLWQAARGIAGAGTSGFGVVGPKTRAAMACY